MVIPAPAVGLPGPPRVLSRRANADLGVTATFGDGSGGTEYELSVANHGPRTAPGVLVTAPVPDGATVIAISRGCMVRSATIFCALGSPAPLGPARGRSFNRRITLAVAPRGGGPLPFFATVTGILPDRVPPMTSPPAPGPPSARSAGRSR